jgi:hypothetical protein
VGKNRGKKDRKFKRFNRFERFRRFRRFKVQEVLCSGGSRFRRLKVKEVLPQNAVQEVKSFKNPPFFQDVGFKYPA